MENQNLNQNTPQASTFGQASPPPRPTNPTPEQTPAPAQPGMNFTPPAPQAQPPVSQVQSPAPAVPPTPPQTPTPSPAPSPPATSEPTQEAAPAPAKPKFKLNIKKPSRKAVILAVVFVVAVLGAAGGVYYWQQGKIDEKQAFVKEVSDGNTTLRLQLTKLQMTEKPALAAAMPGASASDELVLDAAREYCSASVDPATKKPLVFKASKAGTAQNQVLYSADKNFASVSAACSKDGAGSASTSYLKKVDGSWIVLYRAQSPNPEYTKQFNVPADFK